MYCSGLLNALLWLVSVRSSSLHPERNQSLLAFKAHALLMVNKFLFFHLVLMHFKKAPTHDQEIYQMLCSDITFHASSQPQLSQTIQLLDAWCPTSLYIFSVLCCYLIKAPKLSWKLHILQFAVLAK